MYLKWIDVTIESIQQATRLQPVNCLVGGLTSKRGIQAMACFRVGQQLHGHKDSVLCCKHQKDSKLIASGGEVGHDCNNHKIQAQGLH